MLISAFKSVLKFNALGAGSGDDWTGECKTGKEQSPIDLPEKDSAPRPTLCFVHRFHVLETCHDLEPMVS